MCAHVAIPVCVKVGHVGSDDVIRLARSGAFPAAPEGASGPKLVFIPAGKSHPCRFAPITSHTTTHCKCAPQTHLEPYPVLDCTVLYYTIARRREPIYSLWVSLTRYRTLVHA